MLRCDVIIVGGGPAGSSCAARLHAAGVDVLVIDKAEFPRDKPCGGWVTPPALELTGVDPHEYASSRVMQPITGFAVCRMGGPLVTTDYRKIVSYGIRRREFDQYLLERSGARTSLGESIQAIERDGNMWRINGRYEAPMLVGAGGHFCPVARHLGAKPGGQARVVAAQEVEFGLSDDQIRTCPIKPEVPELYFCEDLVGYGWCFRKERFLNVGLGREDSVRLSGHVKQFVKMLQDAGRIPGEITAPFHGHAYALYGHSDRQVVGDGVLLVGDAVGLAGTHSGEGIRAAIESGLLAGDVILAAKGDYSTRQLEAYGSGLVGLYGPAESSDGVLTLLPMAIKQTLAGWLLSTHWFTRRVVLDRWFLSHNADEKRPGRRLAPIRAVQTA